MRGVVCGERRFIRPSDEGLRMTEGVWDCFAYGSQ